MDSTQRQITKIAREVSKFTVNTMKEEGIGTAEFDFIHLVRHNPGITQAQVRENLKIDKGAAARRAMRLEEKGYLIRKPNPDDGRSQLLSQLTKLTVLKYPKQLLNHAFMNGFLMNLTKMKKRHFVIHLISYTSVQKPKDAPGLLISPKLLMILYLKNN